MTAVIGSEWKVCTFPELPAEEVVAEGVADAILSRAESGSIHWPNPSPCSFVRGAVYDGGGRLVPLSQRHGGTNSDLVVSVNPPILSQREVREARKRVHSGQWLYAGHWMPGFGHFLVETLPTLWPLASRPRDFRGIVAHRFMGRRTEPWQFELVRLLTDVPVEVIDDEPAGARQLTVPARPYRYHQMISPVAAQAWDAIGERIGAVAQGDPVFMSRSRLDIETASKGKRSSRKYRNTAAVDELFAARGFRVVHPELLPLREQVRLMRSAPLLVGQAGSALHLSVFADHGAHVIELGDARTGARIVGTQQAISAVKHQPVAQIPYADDGEGGMDTSRLIRCLDALLN